VDTQLAFFKVDNPRNEINRNKPIIREMNWTWAECSTSDGSRDSRLRSTFKIDNDFSLPTVDGNSWTIHSGESIDQL